MEILPGNMAGLLASRLHVAHSSNRSPQAYTGRKRIRLCGLRRPHTDGAASGAARGVLLATAIREILIRYSVGPCCVYSQANSPG